MSANGRRHILGLNIEGDLLNLQSFFLDIADTTVSTVTACEIGFVDQSSFESLLEVSPGFRRAVWRATQVQAAIGNAWHLASRLPAQVRLAHLLCEFVVRMKRAGLGTDQFAFPFTQRDLSDACGLSVVHLNRTLQRFREIELIQLKQHVLQVLNFERLCSEGEFNPDYLGTVG